MKKQLAFYALKHAAQRLPGVMLFVKRWWWVLLLAALALVGGLIWLAACLVVWAWNTLPHVLAYLVGHFAPVWEAANPHLTPALQTPTPAPAESI